MQYQHYKGGLYEVICEARLEADPGVTMMIYRSLTDGQIWARPNSAFFEEVEHQGRLVPRFAALDE